MQQRVESPGPTYRQYKQSRHSDLRSLKVSTNLGRGPSGCHPIRKTEPKSRTYPFQEQDRRGYDKESVWGVSNEDGKRGRGFLQVSQEAHEEGGQSRDGGSRGDGIALDGLNAQAVLGVVVADGIVGASIADAGTARVGDDGRVDGDDVGHGEEGGQAAADLGEEERTLALLGLETWNKTW